MYKIFKLKNESEERCMKYVRDNTGYIMKVKNIVCKGYPLKKLEGWIICDDANRSIINPEKCKTSDKIKDLIQLGDIVEWKFKDSSYIYINEVIQRAEAGKTLGVYAEEVACLVPLEYIDILKILTKEQFEENSFRLGE